MLVNEPVQFITTDNVTGGYIGVKYTLRGEEGSDERWFDMRCEDVGTSRWSYTVQGCTANEWNTQFLNNIPPDKVKHWSVTKTYTHLKVVCNNVTVLNFNFAADYSTGFEEKHQIWSRRCTALSFYMYRYENVPLSNNGG